MQRCRKRLPGFGLALDLNETSVMQVQQPITWTRQMKRNLIFERPQSTYCS